MKKRFMAVLLFRTSLIASIHVHLPCVDSIIGVYAEGCGKENPDDRQNVKNIVMIIMSVSNVSLLWQRVTISFSPFPGSAEVKNSQSRL